MICYAIQEVPPHAMLYLFTFRIVRLPKSVAFPIFILPIVTVVILVHHTVLEWVILVAEHLLTQLS